MYLASCIDVEVHLLIKVGKHVVLETDIRQVANAN